MRRRRRRKRRRRRRRVYCSERLDWYNKHD